LPVAPQGFTHLGSSYALDIARLLSLADRMHRICVRVRRIGASCEIVKLAPAGD